MENPILTLETSIKDYLAKRDVSVKDVQGSGILFLSGFSFTNIHDSQDSRGKGRLFS